MTVLEEGQGRAGKKMDTYSYRACGDDLSAIRISVEEWLCSKEEGTRDFDVGGPALSGLLSTHLR